LAKLTAIGAWDRNCPSSVVTAVQPQATTAIKAKAIPRLIMSWSLSAVARNWSHAGVSLPEPPDPCNCSKSKIKRREARRHKKSRPDKSHDPTTRSGPRRHDAHGIDGRNGIDGERHGADQPSPK
jgi:hypothetical protein